MYEVEKGHPEEVEGWSWARLVVAGEDFRTGPDEWDRAIEAAYAVPDRVRWTSPDERVTADFAVVGGRVVCLEVKHRGTVDAPVSAGAIRDVRLEEAGRWALLQLASEEVQGRPPTPDELSSPTGASAAFFYSEHKPVTTRQQREVSQALDRQVKGTRGRPPVPRAELEEVARIYSTSASRPVQAVGNLMGLSPTQATRRVQMARKAGLLPPTKQGKAKG